MQKENGELVELLEKLEKINEEAQQELKDKSLENRKLENLIISFQQITIQENLQIRDCRDKFPKLFPEGELLF
jgi:predicted nuclease with TOPRIM domain